MSLDHLPVNAFDIILLAVLLAGLARGRKHGMSEELFSLIKWLVVVFACAALYDPVGTWFAQECYLSILSGYLIVYVGAALLILGAFALVKHSIGGKLLGSDIFGRAEYYLGMCSGVVRYSCIVLAVLALLNARYFTPKEVKAMTAFQQDVYGSEFFPTLHTAQATVFEQSLTGPWIKENLAFLLIRPTKPELKELHQKELDLGFKP
jgi:uncharacterized membrane protein required for colicin V production